MNSKQFLLLGAGLFAAGYFAKAISNKGKGMGAEILKQPITGSASDLAMMAGFGISIYGLLNLLTNKK